MITNERCIKNIRRNLLSEYIKSNKTLAGFACMCEISNSELDFLLYGRNKKQKKNIYLATLITISNALGKSVSWLIGEGKEDNKE